MALLLEGARNLILRSIVGRRLGFDANDYLIGHRDQRLQVEDLSSTVPTTISAFGITRIGTMSSTQGPVQHFLPAPVVGLRKTITMTGTSTASIQFLTTANGAAVINTSLGTTSNAVNFRGPSGYVELVGLTTALWGVLGSGPLISTGQDSALRFTTSTA